jgi:hypothetical protein
MRSFARVAIVAAAGLTILLAGTVPAMAKVADRNHNKIPDSWEKKYHMSTRKNQAKLDFDKDGLSNINEYLAGTNPRVKDTNHNGVKDGLEDRDKDGLVNLAEIKAKTNIKVKDTDKDGVIDSLEDPDGDHLTNAQEWKTGTHPLIADTDDNGIDDGDEDADEDGLSNTQEFECGTNPRIADSDDDGVDDCDEDADEDGVDNHTEFEEGTDPCDADSDHDGVRDGQEIRGMVASFDPDSGLLTITLQHDEDDTATMYEVTVDSATVLTWAECDEGETAPAADPTLDDLFEGAILRDVKTVAQPDGSLLATDIRIVPVPAEDPDLGGPIAEVGFWDADAWVLTVNDLLDPGTSYDVLVDDMTVFEWAVGTTSDHEAGVDDLIEGTGIADIYTLEESDGLPVATMVVLVPLVEVPVE